MEYDPSAKHHGQRNDLALRAKPYHKAGFLKSGPAAFSSSPNQTHLSKPIKLFGVITKIKVGEFDQGLS